VLIGAGDIARCDRTFDEATAAVLAANPTATVFTAGDNTNGNASLTDFTNCYVPSWGAHKARTRPAVGENDYKTANAAGYFSYFGPAGGDSAKYYYSYDLGAWHIMALNDNISMAAGSPQEQWLRAELAANTKQCTLAYWHHPRFSSAGTNNLASVKPLWDALYASSADVVVNAHYNVYERFAPQTPDGVADPVKGMREFIAGTGGQGLQNAGKARGNSQVLNETTYGVLKLTLDVGTYYWQLLPIAGQTFTDTGSTACHTHIAVAAVDVVPVQASVLAGATVQLTATPKDAAGNPLTGRVVTWASSDTIVAKVDANGLVTGKAAGGPVTMTATSEGKSGTSAVTVTFVPVASVDVSPAAPSVQAGSTVQLTATPRDAGGSALTGRTVTWQTSDAGVASVDANGLVTGKAAGGPVTITATSEGKSGTSAVTVTPSPVASVAVAPAAASVIVGATVQLTATPRDANGNPLAGRAVTWQTSDATIASVDGNGLVTGKAVGGPVAITATSEGKSGTSAVTVTPVPVASVAVTPAAASVVVGATVQLTATPQDASGNPLTGRAVTWQTSDATIAAVDANGLVTGNAAGGPVTITATSEGKSGTSAITVAAIPIASVDVTPGTGSVQVGATLQLTATPRDVNGNALTGRVITWQPSDAAIATVDANGLVTGKTAGGPVTITATSEGKSGTAAITVTPVPVASVTVAPAPASVAVGATVQLTATPRDAGGNPLTGRTVSWQTSDATIAIVDANGLVTGNVIGGPVTITATSEGKSGTSAVTVTTIPVASVDVTPATGSIQVGATLQLTATPKDANGTPLTGRAVTWQTSDAGVATVDVNGLVTGKAAGGPVTTTAISEGKSGTSAVTVTPIPVATVEVTPGTGSVPLGTTLQLSATPKDANGNALTGRVITWQTSDATIASVDANGLVTGKLVGGPVTITATSEGRSGTSGITVTPIPVASVTVTPATGNVVVSATLQLTATPKDANGNALTGRVITWQTSDATLATVDPNGLVTGQAAGGPVTITATSEGRSGTSVLTVLLLVPVASVTVTPNPGSVQAGATLQLTATLKDVNGNVLTGRTVTWQTSNATIATVDANGLVTGKAAGGPVTITATSEGKSGTSAVTVTPVPVTTVTVTPATASVALGATVQFTATPKDANGNPLTGRLITWQTSAPGVAGVTGSGLVQGLALGSATVTATSEGKSGTASVMVIPAPVASVDVSPASATISANGTVQLTGTPKDANGNALAGRVVTWSSSSPTVAAVNGAGAVVGLQAGTTSVTATSEGQVGTSVITVQPASGPPVIAGAGDIADCSRSSQEATAEVLDKIVGTVVTFGDQAYDAGSLTEYMNCYDPSWGRHKARTRPSPGNHEYNSGSAAGAAGYYSYFGAAAGDPAKGYYSYDLGAWHLIVINSNLDMSAGSAQEQWLRADLAAHPTVCTAAYWHHPRFSSGGNGSTTMAQPIWQALYDYGADLVFNGHDHDYERFAPQTPTGALDNTNGVVEIVAGTGGNALYTWPGNPIANSVVRSNVSYGILKVTLWPTSYDWEFVPIAGGTFTDKGSALCHSGAPLPNQTPIANPGGPYSSEGTLTLDGSQSRDPDNNTPLTYAWTLGDGATATTATVTHTYASQGVYTVTLTVRDSKGLSSTPATTTVTVANVAPAVNAGPDQSVVGGQPLNVRAAFSDVGPTDYPWSYAIAWGDGATDLGSTNTQVNPIAASHVYPTPGRYTVRVTVSDKYGAAAWDELLVKVLNPATVQVFTGASNIASCGTNEDELTAQLLDAIPGSVFVVGDNVNPSGSAANYTTCYAPTWGRHKARTYPVLGNHEYDVAGASGYFGYFGAVAGDPTKGFYSFDLGDWHIIVLNNTTAVASGAGSVQEQWLKADLAASTKYCTAALFHYPLFFSSDDPSWHTASGVLPFWNDLYAAGADVVINGQSYFYERFAPQGPAGVVDSARGITEFNPGTGGYAFGMPASIAPNSQAVSVSYGVLKLTLGPDSFIWQFIPAAGETFSESGSGNCH